MKIFGWKFRSLGSTKKNSFLTFQILLISLHFFFRAITAAKNMHLRCRARYRKKWIFSLHSNDTKFAEFVPKSGYNQGGLWTSQWHPRARAPGCLTMLSHWRIQVLDGSHSFLSILGYLTSPRWEHRCPTSDTIAPKSFIARVTFSLISISRASN